MGDGGFWFGPTSNYGPGKKQTSQRNRNGGPMCNLPKINSNWEQFIVFYKTDKVR